MLGDKALLLGADGRGQGRETGLGVGSRAAKLVGRALEDGEQTLSPSFGILNPSQEGHCRGSQVWEAQCLLDQR